MGRATSASVGEISSSGVGDGARLGEHVRSSRDRLISSILARAASGDNARPVLGRAGASINIARGCSACPFVQAILLSLLKMAAAQALSTIASTPAIKPDAPASQLLLTSASALVFANSAGTLVSSSPVGSI